jgi:hypothetical protein
MLKFAMLTLLVATSVSGCAYSYCSPSAFRGCGYAVDPIYAPLAPMPR